MDDASGTTSLPAVLAGTMSGSLNETRLVWDRYTDAQLFEKYRPEKAIVDTYLSPVWYVIGLSGNTLAFLVWIQPRMRHSSGCYLAALALADFLFLILHLLFELHITWDVHVLDVPVVCEAFPVFFYTMQYLSPLLVLGFTTERYVSICHPFQREKFCTTSRAIKVVLGLVGLSLLMHAVQGYFWVYRLAVPPDGAGVGGDENEARGGGGGGVTDGVLAAGERDKLICEVRPEVVAGKQASIFSVWAWITELLVFGVVPLAILVLNLLVIKEAKKMSDNEEKRLCLKKGTKSSGPSATTFMLLAVSFYLIFTTLPVTIMYTLYPSFPPGALDLTDEALAADPTWQHYLTYWTVRAFIQELGMSHYACNFFIYIATGKQFRRELRRVVCQRCMRVPAERPDYLEPEAPRQTLVAKQHTPVVANANANGAVAHL